MMVVVSTFAPAGIEAVDCLLSELRVTKTVLVDSALQVSAMKLETVVEWELTEGPE